jgi:hypothetical protein
MKATGPPAAGPTIGVSKNGPAPSGTMTESPSLAKNVAIWD